MSLAIDLEAPKTEDFVSQLGKEESVHHRNKYTSWLLTLLLGGFAFIMVFLIAGPMLLESKVGLALNLTFFLFFLATASLPAYMAYRAISDRIRGRNDRVHVHEQGIVIFRYGSSQIVRWSEVEQVKIAEMAVKKFMKSWTEAHVSIKVDTPNRHPWIPVSGFNNSQELAQKIDRMTFQRRFARAISEIRSGQRVEFGVLVASSDGLEYGRKLLPWKEFAGFSKSATLFGGYGNYQGSQMIGLHKKNHQRPIAKYDLQSIPDFSVLESIARLITT